jgi:hypothetical protein
LDWAFVADEGVPSLGVVIAVNVVAERVRRDGMVGADSVVESFCLERGKETLGDGLVSAITLPAHARDRAVAFEGMPVIMACIRASAIGMR